MTELRGIRCEVRPDDRHGQINEGGGGRSRLVGGGRSRSPSGYGNNASTGHDVSLPGQCGRCAGDYPLLGCKSTSTSVPRRTIWPCASSTSFTVGRSAVARWRRSRIWRKRWMVVASGMPVAPGAMPANARQTGIPCNASRATSSASENHCCRKWTRVSSRTGYGGRPVVPAGVTEAIRATRASHGTSANISSAKACRRVRLVDRSKPFARLNWFMPP